MSAEDELCEPPEQPLPDELDPVEFARFWDDAESWNSNIRIIRRWLVSASSKTTSAAEAGPVDLG